MYLRESVGTTAFDGDNDEMIKPTAAVKDDAFMVVCGIDIFCDVKLG